MDLENAEISRYARHLNLPGIGLDGQNKLKNASVLIIGCGGLGIPAMQYLAAAGIGKIGLVDGDIIDISNLQRQVIYRSEDAGKKKVDCASSFLMKLNPEIEIDSYDEFLSSKNALRIIEGYDMVIDATDNIPSRYLINDSCVILSKPMIHGSIYRYEGLISSFNIGSGDDRGPDYRDLFPVPPSPESVPTCEEGGVLGVLPGIIGSMQALEAIKLITGLPGILNGELLLYDALSAQMRKIKVPKQSGRKEITGLIDYESFCNPKSAERLISISPKQLQDLLFANKDVLLIDVREEHEHNAGNIGGTCIPLLDLKNKQKTIEQASTIVFYCKKGERSKKAIKTVKDYLSDKEILHLDGGLLLWQEEIDKSITVI